MGTSRDRVLIIARGECRASNHQVAPVLQTVEPAHDRLRAVLGVCSRNVVVDKIAFARNRARAEMYASALQMTWVRLL